MLLFTVSIFLTPLLIAVYFVYLYNSLVRKRQLVREAWSGVEVQLKRRADLIPSLVEIVKGYAKHEKEIFEKLAEARSKSLSAESPREKVRAEGELTKALKSVIALSESYPDLKANRNFLELQKTLAEVEDELQLARRYYNATVREYNAAIESFPAVLIARKVGFTPEDYFDLDVAAFEEGGDALEQRRKPDVRF